VRLLPGKRIDAVENMVNLNLEITFYGRDDLVNVTEHLFTANTTTGLADKSPPLQKGLYLFTPFGRKPDIDNIGIDVLIICNGLEIIRVVYNPFPKTEPRGMKHLFPGCSHYH